MITTCLAHRCKLHFVTTAAVTLALTFRCVCSIADTFDHVLPISACLGTGHPVEALSYQFRHWKRTLTGAAIAVLSFWRHQT
jgi:hypothetical protein